MATAHGFSSQAILSTASQLYGRDVGEDDYVSESDVSLDEAQEDDGHANNDRDTEYMPDIDLSNDGISRPQQAPELPKLVNDDLHHNKKAWRDIYVARGIRGLAEEVMREDIKEKLQGKGALADRYMSSAIDSMDECLLSTDKRIIESVLYGNLARDLRADSTLRRLLDAIATQSCHQAGIYYQQLVDTHGESPSATDLLKMLDIMEAYVKGCGHALTKNLTGKVDHGIANAIDNFKQTGLAFSKSQAGHRKYMCSRPKKTTDRDWIDMTLNRKDKVASTIQQTLKGAGGLSKEHIIETTHFIRMLRARLHNIPDSERDAPLQFPLCEVGYSVRCMARLAQHASHNSSNYVMNLAEAIFNACRIEFCGSYSIEQHVFYLIWSADQAEIAQIGWSKLAESYMHNAGGFSHYPAGLSNHSASTISAREWDAATACMGKRSPFRHNLAFRVHEFEKIVLAAEEKAAADLRAAQQKARGKSAGVYGRIKRMENKVNRMASALNEQAYKGARAMRKLMDVLVEVDEALPVLDALQLKMNYIIDLLSDATIDGTVEDDDDGAVEDDDDGAVEDDDDGAVEDDDDGMRMDIDDGMRMDIDG